ncbi:hypothetical protein PtA15_6A265 [Puccinia triticina]|uniref:Uncharacterized protein n=1 Tax=Puccinia triticina TaxID=208348 RepID=A0ABY7CNS3_9BASI|nr:uncharacterized protein PtA15_6A265 [Puccinia triticina]WAQ85637.1 hypothetical protein PtA15_6A265 [Puccinia triticina]
MAGPVVGSIFAVLVVIVAVVAGVWYLQRRREKSRMRQEAKRMRSSNFGLYEPGELIHEKRASIEATLEADLARLRNLDVNIPIIVDDYDAKGPQPPTTELSQPFPSLLIARKPSCRVKNSFEVGSLGAAGHHFVPESSANAPGYSQSERAEEYDAYQSPTKATGLYYNLPASALSVKTPADAKPVFQIEDPAHHPPAFFAPEPKSDDAQRSDSINDFQRWCHNQGHIEPSSFDQNSWPQSPSIDSSNREISPLSMAVQNSFSMPNLPPLPPLPEHLLMNPSPSNNPLEFTIHNVDVDSNRKPITLSVDPSRASNYPPHSDKLV